jgi:hypothetical protein
MFPPLPDGPTYRWNETAGRYIDNATGRFISFQTVRDLGCEQVIERAESRMVDLSNQFKSGEISLSEWRAQMAREIKTVNLENAIAASGGRAQMTQADWGAAGARIKAQYRYLDNFAQQIASGQQPLDGTLLSRARLYARAGRATYEEFRRRQRNQEGWQEEQRVLGIAEHCHTSGELEGCVELAGKWSPIGDLPPIGESPCFTNCHCHFTYRRRNRRGFWEYSRE